MHRRADTGFKVRTDCFNRQLRLSFMTLKTGDSLEINRHFCAVATKNKQIIMDWRRKNLK